LALVVPLADSGGDIGMIAYASGAALASAVAIDTSTRIRSDGQSPPTPVGAQPASVTLVRPGLQRRGASSDGGRDLMKYHHSAAHDRASVS
jgi:hypothetical protein